MKTRLLALLFACAAMLVPASGQAQVAPGVVSTAFSITTVGAGPSLVLNGQSSCIVTVSNIGVGATVVPQGSSDNGATWSTVPSIGGGSILAAGVYSGVVATNGLTNFRLFVTAITSGTVSGTQTCSPAGGNEFSGSNGLALMVACDQSVAVNATATTQLVAASGNKAVYVCGFSLNEVSGTSPTFQFEYGTGATCGTGTTVLTGAYTLTPPSVTAAGGSIGTIFRTPAAQALCLVITGTTPSVTGFVSYAQY